MNATILNRYERKFLLNNIQAECLEKTLRQILKKDPYGNDGRYVVRSLYFDNYENSDYYDKEAGVEKHKKIRLRSYYPNDSVCKIEAKLKCGDLQTKISINLNRKESEEIIAGNYKVLLKQQNRNESNELMYKMLQNGLYRPVTLIEYERTAFIHDQYQTRITLDKKIKCKENENRLFDKQLNLWPLLEGYTVLEVKYNEKLIDLISTILQPYNLELTSMSKYCMGRSSINYI